MLCLYFATYNMLFNSLPYDRNATHKYLSRMTHSNIQIYSIYNHISLINPCLNYDYENEFNQENVLCFFFSVLYCPALLLISLFGCSSLSPLVKKCWPFICWPLIRELSPHNLLRTVDWRLWVDPTLSLCLQQFMQ